MGMSMSPPTSGSIQRYLVGDKIYRGGSNASWVGVKNKDGFKKRSVKRNNSNAMRRRMQAMYPQSQFVTPPQPGRPKKV